MQSHKVKRCLNQTYNSRKQRKRSSANESRGGGVSGQVIWTYKQDMRHRWWKWGRENHRLIRKAHGSRWVQTNTYCSLLKTFTTFTTYSAQGWGWSDVAFLWEVDGVLGSTSTHFFSEQLSHQRNLFVVPRTVSGSTQIVPCLSYRNWEWFQFLELYLGDQNELLLQRRCKPALWESSLA